MIFNNPSSYFISILNDIDIDIDKVYLKVYNDQHAPS